MDHKGTEVVVKEGALIAKCGKQRDVDDWRDGYKYIAVDGKGRVECVTTQCECNCGEEWTTGDSVCMGGMVFIFMVLIIFLGWIVRK